MDSAPTPDSTTGDPPRPSAPGWARGVAAFLAWLATCLALCMVIARLAVLAQTQAGFAPFVVFPLLVGAAVGFTAASLARSFGEWPAKYIVTATTLLAIATAPAEHYFYFRDQRQRAFREDYERARKDHPLIELAPPAADLGPRSFWQHVRSQAVYPRPLLWALDAGLELLAAIGVAAIVLRAGRQGGASNPLEPSG